MSDSESIPELTDHLGYWLRVVSNAVSHSFAKKLESKGVTTAEWVVMRVLYDLEHAPPSGVADRMGTTRGAISRLAERLIDKAIIARTEDPSDGRAHFLSLTESGRRLVPQIAALADENDAAFFGHLATQERTRIANFLRRMVNDQSIKSMATD